MTEFRPRAIGERHGFANFTREIAKSSRRRKIAARNQTRLSQLYLRLFFGGFTPRRTAAAFLFNPAGDVRGDILDGYIPGSCAAEENHRFSIDEGDVR